MAPGTDSAETPAGGSSGRAGHCGAGPHSPLWPACESHPSSDMPCATGQWGQKAGLELVTRLTDVSESGHRYSKPGGECGRNRPWSQSITTVACWLASCKTPSTWPHRTRSSKPRTSSFDRVCTRLDPSPGEEFGDQDSFRGSFLSPHSWGF